MKTITINGETYTVEDPDSVSFGVDQNLTDDQKERARQNIGAAAADVIGDIEAALDSILAIQKELIGAKTITFTFWETIECTAEEGMTWGEWIVSDYNTIGATKDDLYGTDEILIGGAYITNAIDNSQVYADTVIIDGANYC